MAELISCSSHQDEKDETTNQERTERGFEWLTLQCQRQKKVSSDGESAMPYSIKIS
jgi:hypothetical protein